MHTQQRLRPSGRKWRLALLTCLPLLAAGCAKPAQSPLATETPAQMQQGIQDHAQNYQKFMQSHPNAYKPGGH